MSRTALRLTITGRVQGVGFRYWTRDRAAALGLSGWVRNAADGSVLALIAGDAKAVERMLADCKQGPPSAAVDRVAAEPSDDHATGPFEIQR